MNIISADILKKANEEAIFNIYLYLAHKAIPVKQQSLQSIVQVMNSEEKLNWTGRQLYRLQILKNAVANNEFLANSKINDFTHSPAGMTACSFTKPDGCVSVVFRGTGTGEWLDNGEGLSGIPEENTYITYANGGEIAFRKIRQNDYATDQQVEALNWFRFIAAKNYWDKKTEITVSGHSKGGNKAQFIAVHSDLVSDCYSFSGQGFSPETLNAFKDMYGIKYEERRQHVRSFAADNDYVNVLGERLVPEDNIYFFESLTGFHFLETTLDKNGVLRPQAEQGRLSLYIENISKELMRIPPAMRQYLTSGIMNIFQKYLGEEALVNGDGASLEQTIADIGVTVGALL